MGRSSGDRGTAPRRPKPTLLRCPACCISQVQSLVGWLRGIAAGAGLCCRNTKQARRGPPKSGNTQLHPPAGRVGHRKPLPARWAHRYRALHIPTQLQWAAGSPHNRVPQSPEQSHTRRRPSSQSRSRREIGSTARDLPVPIVRWRTAAPQTTSYWWPGDRAQSWRLRSG